MKLRSVVDPKNPKAFAPWVRALRGVSGVYRITMDGIVLYVGSAANGDLYGTLTRHVQKWARYRSTSQPGQTFDRFDIEAAVEVCDSSVARALEELWIEKYEPQLNEKSAAVLQYEKPPRGRRVDDDGPDVIDEIIGEVEEWIPF